MKKNPANPTLAFAALLCGATIVVAAGGCAGYRIGNRGLYPDDVETVYVPVFESSSFRRNLGERLTEAVAKEIERVTPYKVVNHADADTILTGRIVSETKRVVAESPTDEPRQVQVNFGIEVSWVDRCGKTLRETVTVPMPAELTKVSASADLVPEVGQSVATAHQEAIKDLAVQIVSLMERPW